MPAISIAAAGRRAEADEHLRVATYLKKAGATRMFPEAEALLRESA